MTDSWLELSLAQEEEAAAIELSAASDPELPYTSFSESLQPARLPPSRKNLAKDPSFTSVATSGNWTTTNVTATEELTTTWVGDTAAHLDVTVASHNSRWGTPTTVGNAMRILATAGTAYSVALRAVAIPANPSRAGRLVVEFRNSSSAVLSTERSSAKVIPTSGWVMLRGDNFVAPANTAFMTVSIEWLDPSSTAIPDDLTFTWLTAGDEFIVDGLDVHAGTQYDMVYVDGDQPDCAWDGTPNASTSTRTTPANRELPASEQVAYGRFYRGFGGSYVTSCRIFRADKHGKLLEDISGAFLSGTVTASEENEGSMWSFSGEFTDPIDLEPYVDFVAPFLRIEYANGKIVDDGSGYGVQMGLYVVIPPRKTVTYTESRYQMDGRDKLWLLSRARYSGVEVEPTGVVITDRVQQRLNAFGFTEHVIQRSSRRTGRERTFDVASSGVEVNNELLKAIGYYPLTPSRTGHLVSYKVLDLMVRQPNAILLGGEDGAVLEPYDVEPETEIFNQVTVYKDDDSNPLRYTISNTDPTSPTRIARIGLHAMPPVNFSEAETQADVEAEARRLLQEKSSVMLNAKLRTMPQPWHNLREVYYLHLKQSDGSSVREAYGRYWCKGWTISFSQTDATMEHSLYKLTAFATDV